MRKLVSIYDYNREIFDLFGYFLNNKKTDFGRVDNTFITALRNIESEVCANNIELRYCRIEFNLFNVVGVNYTINNMFNALDSSERNDLIEHIERAVNNNSFIVLISYKE